MNSEVELCFPKILNALKTDKFTIRELIFIRDFSEALLKVTEKLIIKAKERQDDIDKH